MVYSHKNFNTYESAQDKTSVIAPSKIFFSDLVPFQILENFSIFWGNNITSSKKLFRKMAKIQNCSITKKAE